MGLRRRRVGRETSQEAAPPAPSAEPAPVLTIDALGRKCPIPIIMLAERIGEVPVGQIIAVQADDVAARTDVPAWCRMKSQDFVREEPLPRGWAFHVRRMY
jgi:tRNA 2-thiouridine synthesizing protein A